MFDIQNIYTDRNKVRFLCDYYCDSEQQAKSIVAQFLIPVRSYYPDAELYSKGNILILDTPNKEKTFELSKMINKSIAQ